MRNRINLITVFCDLLPEVVYFCFFGSVKWQGFGAFASLKSPLQNSIKVNQSNEMFFKRFHFYSPEIDRFIRQTITTHNKFSIHQKK